MINSLKILLVAFAINTSLFGISLAAGGVGIGAIANNIIDTLSDVARLITAGAFIAGIGFAVGAIMKFKQHKDNPTQIPIGTPIALIFVAAALLYLPSIIREGGETVFGAGGGDAGGIEGTDLADLG